MATGSQILHQARAALGASEGAATTPTRLLYVPSEGLDFSGLQQFETIEDRPGWNKRDQLRALYNGLESNRLVFNNVPCTFEDFGFYLSSIPGMESDTAGEAANTPTTTDTSAYTRTFLPDQTAVGGAAAAAGYDMHVQLGPSDLVSTVGWSVPGLRCTDMSVVFKKRASGTDSGILMTGTWETYKTATQITAFTGSLTDRTQTLAIGNQFKAYVDSSTIGSTADPEITEATFHVANQAAFHDGADASAAHTSMHFPNPQMSDLTITRKFSNTTELTAYLARTVRKVRIIFEGAVVGATTAKNTIQLDFYGSPREHVPMVWIDGILYAQITLDGVYDSTNTAAWKFITISTVSGAYTTL